MPYSSKSPQERRGGSQKTPKHGESVQTTQTAPREERAGAEDEAAKFNKANSRYNNGPLRD
jgi:hypothetical protein